MTEGRPEDGPPLPSLIGDAPAFVEAASVARRFAPSDAPILLVGPTGSGKDLLARHIHAWSGCKGRFVDVNCAAIPEGLAESVLFGHRRGAFSGAVEHAVGLMEHADGGTLFFDELCSLPRPVQAKLRRAIECGTIRRVGEARERAVQLRLISAAQEPLDERVAAGTFRLDLLQRMAGVVIILPPLSQRGRDVVLLGRAFAREAGRELDADAACLLAESPWPGNVRELRAVVRRAAWLSSDPVLHGEAIAEARRLGPSDASRRQARATPEGATRLLSLCEAQRWDAGRVAESLGVHRTTLYRRLRSLGVSLRENKWPGVRLERAPNPTADRRATAAMGGRPAAGD